jgi:hypothetical protein
MWDIAKERDYDLLVKVDNDCLLVSSNVIKQMVEVYQDLWSRNFAAQWVLSPRVSGLRKQPERARNVMFGGRRVGVVGIVGGIFQFIPKPVLQFGFRYPEDLRLGTGQDDYFCDWFLRQGGYCGYVEGLEVQHYLTTDGQEVEMPEYFERKRMENAI